MNRFLRLSNFAGLFMRVATPFRRIKKGVDCVKYPLIENLPYTVAGKPLYGCRKTFQFAKLATGKPICNHLNKQVK